jgi:tryptophan synthase alpha chain
MPKKLAIYLMAADGDTLSLMHSASKNGADIIELGLAFSDNSAEGEVIQRATIRALANGASVKNTLAILTEFRKANTTTPVILMGYYNNILQYGVEKFSTDFANAQGVIIVDLPLEEEAEFTKKSSVPLIKLIAPTTPEVRIKEICKTAQNFIYYVAVKGITGTKSADISEVAERVALIKKYTTLPVAVGFGIKTPQDAASMPADIVVIGSKIVEMANSGEDIGEFIRSVKDNL